MQPTSAKGVQDYARIDGESDPLRIVQKIFDLTILRKVM